MIWFASLHEWLKRPFWFSLTNVDPHVAAALREAQCYQTGFANGQQAGAAQAFESVEQIIRDRNGIAATQDDVDEARKVRVH